MKVVEKAHDTTPGSLRFGLSRRTLGSSQLTNSLRSAGEKAAKVASASTAASKSAAVRLKPDTTARRGGALRGSGMMGVFLSLTALHRLCSKCVRGDMTSAINRTIVACCLAIVCAPAFGQSRDVPRPSTEAASDEGIPVDSALVKSRCGSCHRSDDKGRMSRISFRRATAENWERTIKRMVTLNHVTLTPEDARNILKYLTDHQGLAPEELRPIAFEGEHRLVEYSYTLDEPPSTLCSSCHSIARVLSERRTKEEWELLITLHRALYPLVDNQPMNGGSGFMRAGGRGGGGRGNGRAGGRGRGAGRGGPGGAGAGWTPPGGRNPGESAPQPLGKTVALPPA